MTGDYNLLHGGYIEYSRREPPTAQPPVSIRELKSRLSHYLRLTRAGESVVITDHGVPIGRIVPIGPHPAGRDLGGRLAAMRDAGLVRWSGHKLPANC